jgi:hypothetical protein
MTLSPWFDEDEEDSFKILKISQAAVASAWWPSRTWARCRSSSSSRTSSFFFVPFGGVVVSPNDARSSLYIARRGSGQQKSDAKLFRKVRSPGLAGAECRALQLYESNE